MEEAENRKRRKRQFIPIPALYCLGIFTKWGCWELYPQLHDWLSDFLASEAENYSVSVKPLSISIKEGSDWKTNVILKFYSYSITVIHTDLIDDILFSDEATSHVYGKCTDTTANYRDMKIHIRYRIGNMIQLRRKLGWVWQNENCMVHCFMPRIHNRVTSISTY